MMGKKRRIVTIEEWEQMSWQEKEKFIEEDERLLSEGVGDRNQGFIDYHGMTVEEVAEKFGYISGDEAFDNLFKRLEDAKKIQLETPNAPSDQMDEMDDCFSKIPL